MTSGTNFRTVLVQYLQSKREKMPGLSRVRWRRWVAALGVLVVSSQAYSADAPFNFDEFTGNKPFTLNTIWTTPFWPALGRHPAEEGKLPRVQRCRNRALLLLRP